MDLEPGICPYSVPCFYFIDYSGLWTGADVSGNPAGIFVGNSVSSGGHYHFRMDLDSLNSGSVPATSRFKFSL